MVKLLHNNYVMTKISQCGYLCHGIIDVFNCLLAVKFYGVSKAVTKLMDCQLLWIIPDLKHSLKFFNDSSHRVIIVFFCCFVSLFSLL